MSTSRRDPLTSSVAPDLEPEQLDVQVHTSSAPIQDPWARTEPTPLRESHELAQTMTPVRWARALFVAAAALLFWSILGEPWEMTSDSALYLRMAAGDLVQAPFGYRLLSPGLVSLLPLAAAEGFALLAYISLIGAGVALFAYALAAPRSDQERSSGAAVAWVTVAFFLTSYAYSYYGTIKSATDPPVLAMLAATLALLARGRSSWLVGLLLASAVLAHEMALVLLPILWLDRMLGAGTLGRRRISWGALVLITVCGLVSYLGSRSLIPVAPAGDQVSYMTTPQAMIGVVLAYSGGLAKHAQRIYAAFGPALVFALLAGVFMARGRARLFVPAVVLVGVGLTFLATDTLRVMAVIFPVVMLFAARLVVAAGRHRGVWLAVSLVGTQVAYSWIVFGHLRSFEGSFTLKLAAMAISAVALLLAVVAVWPVRGRSGVLAIAPVAPPVHQRAPSSVGVEAGA